MHLIGIMQREVPLLPTSQRESFTELFDQYASGNLIGALALNGGAQGRKGALFVRLNRHGMLEEIEKRQSQLISLTTEQKSLADELFKINNQLGSLALDAEQRQKMVLRQSEVERDLYRLLPEITPRVVSVDQVALTLPRNSALIEFQKYQPYRHGHARNGRWQQAHYLALVLNADGLVSVYELGAANTIDQRIQQAVTASEQQLEDAENLWESVGELILSPLEHAIRGMETLFISPDAELNRLPFASLPDRSSDQLFGDVVKLRLLTTGRELLELGQPSAGPKNAALVVANPDFDQLPVEVAAIRTMQNRNKSGVGQQRSTDSETLHWSPLPATEKEGESIAKLTNARLLTQRHASASAVQSAEAPRMIHIASHAFFLADQSKTQKTATAIARSSQAGTDGLRTAAIQGENPLLRSGIALAGANRALQQTAASDDDGYLTALEVAQLDWKGTELVVISACESGRGDIRAGEGVYGLKRAIAVAGARSSLLSLWKVDDAATAAFMQSFYERLKAGTPRADALAATQKQFRQHPIPAWRHPYVWAAFQLSGDWRSIEW